MPGAKVLHVSEDEIVKKVAEKKPWDNVQNVPGIKKVHCIVCEKDDRVKLFTDDLNEDVLTTVNYGECESEEESEKDVDSECLKGDWVAVIYDDKYYPGQVTQVAKNGSMKVNVMRPCFPSCWKWPSNKDEIFYKKENIVKKICPPIPIDARGGWQFKESTLKNY